MPSAFNVQTSLEYAYEHSLASALSLQYFTRLYLGACYLYFEVQEMCTLSISSNNRNCYTIILINFSFTFSCMQSTKFRALLSKITSQQVCTCDVHETIFE